MCRVWFGSDPAQEIDYIVVGDDNIALSANVGHLLLFLVSSLSDRGIVFLREDHFFTKINVSADLSIIGTNIGTFFLHAKGFL